MGHPTERQPAPAPLPVGHEEPADGARLYEPTTKVFPVIVPPTGEGAPPVALAPAPGAPRPEDAPPYVPPQRWRPRKAVVLTVLGVLAATGLYTAAQWSLRERVPAGTTVAGVNLGNLYREEAVARLEQQLVPRSQAPVVLVAGEATADVEPEYAGLSLDVEATVDSLTGFSLNPVRLWAHLMGSDEASPAVTIQRERLDAVASVLAERLYVEPVDGTVGFDGDRAVFTEAKQGSRVTASDVAATVAAEWLLTEGPFEVPAEPVVPAITEAATADAYAQAQLVVSGPVVVEAGGQQAELPPEVLAAATTFEQIGGVLSPRFDGEVLHAAVIDRTTDLLAEPTNARFTFVEGRPQISGGAVGTTLDAEALATAVQVAAIGTERSTAVELVEREPEHTAEALQALGITEVVGSFSTGVTSDVVRTNNLRRGGEILTGQLVLPGQQFSLLDALGPITEANGFGNAPVIVNGQFVPGRGGGLSQMATNVYNAAHFAGFQIDERQPHSVFIPRYPAGREATIFTGSIDLKWTNNTPYGALIRSWVGGGQLHVQIWSSPHFRVESSTSPRRDVVPAEMRPGPAQNCAARPAGQDGFAVTTTRRVFLRSNDQLVSETSHTWRYRPDHGTTCYVPAPPPPATEYGED